MTSWTTNHKVLFILAIMAIGTNPGRGHEQTYAVGGGGWRLERFGDSVAILRTTVTPRSPASDRTGLLLLSCEGSERRLRLDLPEGRGTVPRNASRGRALFAARSEPPATFAKVAFERGRLTVSDGRTVLENAVLRLVRLLRTQPAGVDLLLHDGSGPITIGRVVPYRLSLTFEGSEGVAFDDFLSACSPSEP